MDKNTVVIAIDHGWSNMKTVHETFTSGIREITTEPALFENVLEKDGKYYKVGSERLKVKDSKEPLMHTVGALWRTNSVLSHR